ncbi:uncharacterized protein OCT59_012710 [Rhizophagus irregularis]|uniref:uncharacterized protein n=1 Tax=Rhizophagus irregularis TaxID=588596 RepID=UPI0033264F9D|nr:hypothetical protein OCT59_012710 [Rhizophagus irregularis]
MSSKFTRTAISSRLQGQTCPQNLQGQKCPQDYYEDKNVLNITRTNMSSKFIKTIMSLSYEDKMSTLIRSHDHCLVLANKNRGFHGGYNLCI